jgi:hypothetical protein
MAFYFYCNCKFWILFSHLQLALCMKRPIFLNSKILVQSYLLVGSFLINFQLFLLRRCSLNFLFLGIIKLYTQHIPLYYIRGYLPLSDPFLIPFRLQILALNNAIPLLSFLEQQAIYSSLANTNFISQINVSDHIFFRYTYFMVNKNYCIEAPINGITSIINFMKIYQVVQNISIDSLYLRPAMPLGRFCSAVNN